MYGQGKKSLSEKMKMMPFDKLMETFASKVLLQSYDVINKIDSFIGIGLVLFYCFIAIR